MSGEKKSWKNTGREKESWGKISTGRNLVTCKKFSHFSPTFFFPIRCKLIEIINLNLYRKNTTNIQATPSESDRHLALTVYRFAHGCFFTILRDILCKLKPLIVDVFNHVIRKLATHSLILGSTHDDLLLQKKKRLWGDYWWKSTP